MGLDVGVDAGWQSEVDSAWTPITVQKILGRGMAGQWRENRERVDQSLGGKWG